MLNKTSQTNNHVDLFLWCSSPSWAIQNKNQNRNHTVGHVLLVKNYLILSLKSTRELRCCRPKKYVHMTGTSADWFECIIYDCTCAVIDIFSSPRISASVMTVKKFERWSCVSYFPIHLQVYFNNQRAPNMDKRQTLLVGCCKMPLDNSI